MCCCSLKCSSFLQTMYVLPHSTDLCICLLLDDNVHKNIFLICPLHIPYIKATQDLKTLCLVNSTFHAAFPPSLFCEFRLQVNHFSRDTQCPLNVSPSPKCPTLGIPFKHRFCWLCRIRGGDGSPMVGCHSSLGRSGGFSHRASPLSNAPPFCHTCGSWALQSGWHVLFTFANIAFRVCHHQKASG